MAEESDLEKTEPASPRRLEKAREEGQVVRSRELNTFLLLSAGVAGLWFGGAHLYRELSGVVRAGLWFDARVGGDTAVMLSVAAGSAMRALLALMPLFGLLVVVAILASVLLGGFLLSAKALEPKFERMNLLKGVKRMFSAQTLVALCSGLIVASLLLIVLIDAPWQMFSHFKKLRMSRQDVKQEHKESEGDPHVKGRIRQQQRAMARRRMMSEVPRADVVVTNPTHVAVALSYAEGGAGAPRVVAKGAGLVAQSIRRIAQEHRVPQLSAPPLARALNKHVELGHEIPVDLYSAVAQVLAWVYQLKRWENGEGLAPILPDDLPVPPALDPKAGAMA